MRKSSIGFPAIGSDSGMRAPKSMRLCWSRCYSRAHPSQLFRLPSTWVSSGEPSNTLTSTKLEVPIGPDSWSNADLKQMPESFLPHLQSLLQAFTDTATWPQALLRATVTMLSKVDSTFDIGQTRPIAYNHSQLPVSLVEQTHGQKNY